jgi:hypothetical protein
MCEKCLEIDEKIERYRRLAKQISDPMANEQAERLIADLKAKKDSFHPK